MIRFALRCESDHEFEAWFRSNDDCEKQTRRGLVSCPECGSAKVAKALMAPSVSTARRKETMALAADAAQKQALAKLRELARQVRDNAENVGEKFPEEARRIHFGEAEARGIYGEASADDVRSLIEDGVEIMPLPVFPEDRN